MKAAVVTKDREFEQLLEVNDILKAAITIKGRTLEKVEKENKDLKAEFRTKESTFNRLILDLRGTIATSPSPRKARSSARSSPSMR